MHIQPRSFRSLYLSLTSVALLLCVLSGCQVDTARTPTDEQVMWNPPKGFTLIDKEGTSTLSHLKVAPNLDSAAIRQLVYVAVNTDIFITGKDIRLPLSNTLCIRNVSVDLPIIVNQVEYYDAEGIKLKAYLEHPVELRPLQSIWLILQGGKEASGTGTNFLIDWASIDPVQPPIIESMMAGSYTQMGLSFKSESVVVKEWRRGVEVPVE